jgi:hypothetical protein
MTEVGWGGGKGNSRLATGESNQGSRRASAPPEILRDGLESEACDELSLTHAAGNRSRLHVDHPHNKIHSQNTTLYQPNSATSALVLLWEVLPKVPASHSYDLTPMKYPNLK